MALAYAIETGVPKLLNLNNESDFSADDRHQCVIKKSDNYRLMKINCTPTFHCIGFYKIRECLACCFFLFGVMMDPIAFAQSTPQGAPAFDIFEYQVQGNSRLQDNAIEQAVTPFLGEGKSFQDVASARAALETAYHDAGYLTVIVTIPEQKVDEGVVTLLVNEVPVDKLRIAGSQYHEPSAIRAQVPELAEGNVPNFPEMQRELTAVNRTADLKATPVLRAGQTPGSVEAELDIDDQLPVHGSLELSNRESPNTTPMRLSGAIRYDNLFQSGQSLGLSTQLSPQDISQVKVFSGTYVVPLGDEGDAFTLYGVHSRSSLASLANSPGLGVLGNTDIIGMRYALPLPASENYIQNLSAGPDYKRVNQTITAASGNETTPINYVPLVATYTGTFLGSERPTTFEATATLGVRGLLGNADAEFEEKRGVEGSANYFVLRSDIQHTEEVFKKWTLFAKLEFQAASGPLVSNEQFVAGGAESVRGYLEGEAAGDDGLHGMFELHTPEFKPAGPTSLWSMNGLLFFDTALLHTSYAEAPQATNQNIHSSGIGYLLTAPRGFAFQMYLAHAYDNAQITKAGSNRVQAHLEWDY
jgi:hemolysin activation/secretion protein